MVLGGDLDLCHYDPRARWPGPLGVWAWVGLLVVIYVGNYLQPAAARRALAEPGRPADLVVPDLGNGGFDAHRSVDGQHRGASAIVSCGRWSRGRRISVSSRRGVGPRASAEAPAANAEVPEDWCIRGADASAAVRGGGWGSRRQCRSACGHAEPRTVHPRRRISVSSRRGWGPAASAEAPAAMPSRDCASESTHQLSSRRGVGPAARAEAPCGMPSLGLCIRGDASASVRGWGGPPRHVPKSGSRRPPEPVGC